MKPATWAATFWTLDRVSNSGMRLSSKDHEGSGYAEDEAADGEANSATIAPSSRGHGDAADRPGFGCGPKHGPGRADAGGGGGAVLAAAGDDERGGAGGTDVLATRRGGGGAPSRGAGLGLAGARVAPAWRQHDGAVGGARPGCGGWLRVLEVL